MIREWKFLTAISLVYFLTRIIFLWLLPLFEDEALFTSWSSEMAKSWKNYQLPLSAGISPFFSWFTSPLLLITPNQFLAGRLVSIFSGFLTTLLIFFLLNKLVNNIQAFILSLVYIFLPMVFIYNTLAVLESLMVFFIITAVYFCWQYLESGKIISIIFCFIAFFLGILTKPIALISHPAIIIALIVSARFKWRKIFMVLISLILSLICFYLILIPYKMPTTSFLNNYFFYQGNIYDFTVQIKKNLWLAGHWLKDYYPPIFLFFSLAGLVSIIKNKLNLTRYYAIIFIIYFILIIWTDKIFFPRHTFVWSPFLIFFVGCFISWIDRFSYKLGLLLSVGLIFMAIFYFRQLVLAPEKSFYIAREDKFQFYEDWTSGRVLGPTADYLEKQNQKEKKMLIWTDGSLIYRYGLPLYLKNKANFIFNSIDKPEDISPANTDEVNYYIANKIKPKGIKYVNEKHIFVSSRHEIIIYQLN